MSGARFSYNLVILMAIFFVLLKAFDIIGSLMWLHLAR